MHFFITQLYVYILNFADYDKFLEKKIVFYIFGLFSHKE